MAKAISNISIPTKNLLKNIRNQKISVKNTKFNLAYPWETGHEQFSKNENILIKDKNQLLRKLNNIRSDGVENLQVVTDFDFTITPFQYKGKSSQTCFGILQQSGHVPEKFKSDLETVFKKYFPFEDSTELSEKEKEIYMLQWNQAKEKIFRKAGLDDKMIQKSMQDSHIGARYGFGNYFKNCYDRDIPFYVVSGGINVVIQSFLKGYLDIGSYKDLHIFSNDLSLDEKGRVIDMEMKINTTSKQQILDKKNQNFRKNCFLFGDSGFDIQMAKNMGQDNVISVFFMHEKYSQKTDYLFQNEWDILIKSEDYSGVEQVSYLVPNVLLSYVSQGQQNERSQGLVIDQDWDNFQNMTNYSELNQILYKDYYQRQSENLIKQKEQESQQLL